MFFLQRSDYLRYVLICFEGGIYTDTDTSILKSFAQWGSHPDEHNASQGPASLIIGIEADVYVRLHSYVSSFGICLF